MACCNAGNSGANKKFKVGSRVEWDGQSIRGIIGMRQGTIVGDAGANKWKVMPDGHGQEFAREHTLDASKLKAPTPGRGGKGKSRSEASFDADKILTGALLNGNIAKNFKRMCGDDDKMNLNEFRSACKEGQGEEAELIKTRVSDKQMQSFWKRLVAKVDRDGDGELDLEEFALLGFEKEKTEWDKVLAKLQNEENPKTMDALKKRFKPELKNWELDEGTLQLFFRLAERHERGKRSGQMSDVLYYTIVESHTSLWDDIADQAQGYYDDAGEWVDNVWDQFTGEGDDDYETAGKSRAFDPQAMLNDKLAEFQELDVLGQMQDHLGPWRFAVMFGVGGLTGYFFAGPWDIACYIFLGLILLHFLVSQGYLGPAIQRYLEPAMKHEVGAAIAQVTLDLDGDGDIDWQDAAAAWTQGSGWLTGLAPDLLFALGGAVLGLYMGGSTIMGFFAEIGDEIGLDGTLG